MSELIDLFPLSIYATKLGFSAEQRAEFTDMIVQDADSNQPIDKHRTGDANGIEYLHNRKEFRKLFTEVNKHIGIYFDKLGVETSLFDFYFTRSWGTVSKEQEQIALHTHRQSHLSAVYYPRVPEGSGALVTNMAENPNEFMPNLISHKHFASGVIKGSQYLAENMNVLVADDNLLIFPSKTRHATELNTTGQIRVSVAADIICVLKNSEGHEYFVPPFKMWAKF